MFSALAIRSLIDVVSPPMRRPSVLREYLEQHAYSQLLTENSRLDYIAKTYGAKLVAKWEASKSGEPAVVQNGVNSSPGEDEQQKLISYFTSIDPSPNKELTQWLIIRYLRDQFRLEDAQAAHDEVLPDFLTMRRNLPAEQRDINRYPSLGDIRAVLRSTQEQDIPAEDPVLDAKMHEQAKVVYNGPDVKIIIPLTVAASCYFGKGTDWCTAKYGETDSRNYYNSYNSSGPLYIIYDKKTRKRVQLHFQTDQYMDEQDRQIDLGAYVAEHPAVVDAIGEDKWLKVAGKIGLRWFRPEMVAQIPADRLVYMIKTRQDLKRVPLEMQTEPDFVYQLLYRTPAAIAWLPRDAYAHDLSTLVQKIPATFRYLPADLQNAELAGIASKWSRGWKQIEQNIPPEWMTPEVHQNMWNDKIANDTSLKLKDVPKEFWSPSVIVNTMARNPADIPNNVELLTPELVHQIAQKNIEAIKEIPEQFLGDDLAKMIEAKVSADKRSYTQGDYALRGYQLFGRFPSKYWTEAATKYLAGSDVKFPYERIPEHYRTPEITDAYLLSHLSSADTVPHQYLTDDVLIQALRKSYYGAKLFQHLDPRLFTDKVLDGVAAGFHQPGSGNASGFYQQIPMALRRPEIRRTYMKLNAVPVAEMVPGAITEEGLVDRVGDHPEETNTIPQGYWTPEFAVKLVDRQMNTLAGIPDSMLSEPLLWAYLSPLHRRIPPHDPNHPEGSMRTAAAEQIKRFPPKLWSSRTYAAAIEHGFIKPDVANVPPELVDSQVAGVILGRNANELTKLSPDLINDESLSLAVKANLNILTVLTPEQITEPVAYAAMDRWAGATSPDRRGFTYSYQKEQREILDKIPHEVWSKRVYEAAVGYLVNLKQVPGKYRDKAMIHAALRRDPSNAQYMRDPAKFLNANSLGAAQQSGDWKTKLEASGVIPLKDGSFTNISDMQKETLPSGYQVGILPLGRTNKRLYLFDPKGKYICYLYTDKKKVWFPDAAKFVKYQAPLAELAKKYLGGFEPWELNSAGVYGHSSYSGGNWFTENTASRKKDGAIEWSDQVHVEGEMYVAWFKNKPILRAYTEASKGMYGRGGNAYIREFKVYDWPIVLKYATDIMHYAAKHMYQSDSYHWQPLGYITTNRRGGGTVINVGEKQIGKVGDYAVKSSGDGKYIGIFGPMGMIAYGIYRKGTGAIENVQEVGESRYHRTGDSIERAFVSIANYLRTKSTATMALPKN